MQTILAVDDEQSVREAYRVILAGKYHVILAENATVALKIIEETHVDLVLLDLMMPGLCGVEVIDEIRKRIDDMPIIVVTATRSVTTAVDAIKRGAREYIIKPFDVDEILYTVQRILSEEKKHRELAILREAEVTGFESLIGQSPALMDALNLARRAMDVDSTVLITGESGTGKDLLARAIHSGGKRANEAFVPVSCCAIPEQLVESELFGHEKGAFTGATERRFGKVQVADRGTLFLDEIGEMPLEAQSKLLRVLQESQICPVGSSKIVEVDVRFICATNRDLKEQVHNARFREDLFYRINVLPIEMPPLRKRREDIPPLVSHFVKKHGPRANAQVSRFTPRALAVLAACEWPGNVRELENTIERILVHHGHEDVIREKHLQDILPATSAASTATLAEFEGLTLDEATRRLERHLILRALERSGYNQSKAAELLGTTRRILKYKMDQIGVGAVSSQQSKQTT